MEYEVISASSTDEFEAQITVRLGLGWKPQGGISVVYVPSSDELFYYQAMTK